MINSMGKNLILAHSTCQSFTSVWVCKYITEKENMSISSSGLMKSKKISNYIITLSLE